MEKVGILIVCYGARETAMVDAFARSPNYNVKLRITESARFFTSPLIKSSESVRIWQLQEHICRRI